MKMFRLLIVLLLPTMLLLNSCSDNSSDTPKTPTGNKYFPTVIGSWWTYTNYDLDSLNNKIAESEFQDKVVLDSTEMIAEKKAYVYKYLNMDGTPTGAEDNYLYATTTQIFHYFSIVPETDFSLPIEIPTDWYKIADYNDTEWTLYTQTVEDMEMETGNGTAKLSGDIAIKIKNDGTDNVNYGANLDKTVDCKVFTLTFSFEGNMTMAGIPIPIPFNFSVVNKNYYGNGIGLVKNETLPFAITINVFGQEKEVYSANGSEQVLLDYKIGE